MNPCCLRSFVEKGFAERFQLSQEGAEHTCEACRTTYVLVVTGRVGNREQLTWTERPH